MNDRFSNAFDGIVADEALKKKTEAYVAAEMERRSRRTAPRRIRFAAALAALILAFGSIGTYSAYAMPVSYIEIEATPAVELSLNRFDRVIGAEAKNEVGEALLEGLSLKHMKYTDAVEAVLESAAHSGVLANNSEPIITITSKNSSTLAAGIKACEGFNRYRCRFGGSQSGGNGTGSQSGRNGTGSQSGGYGTGSQSGGNGTGSQSGGYGAGSQSGGYGAGSQSSGYGAGSQSSGYGRSNCNN